MTTHACAEASRTSTLAGRGVSKARVPVDDSVSWGTKLTTGLVSRGFGVLLRFRFGLVCVLGHALAAWASYLHSGPLVHAEKVPRALAHALRIDEVYELGVYSPNNPTTLLEPDNDPFGPS